MNEQKLQNLPGKRRVLLHLIKQSADSACLQGGLCERCGWLLFTDTSPAVDFAALCGDFFGQKHD